MPITDIDRLVQSAANPRALVLWQALQALKSCVSFMNTGAHPDDETSAMLAALGWRDGISVSYACANRGEGGQNSIGTEASDRLGVLRTAEMERACAVLNLRLYWLSESPDDSIFDFGFSKSGDETLSRWGRARTLKRFVEIVRQERPDVICPTFLDIPGQHGHHRAMTSLAHEVMQVAGDAAFDIAGLPPWQVKKLYLPAWSGAGDSYDDDLPPPAATLTVEAKGEDPFSGWSYENIGQQSRRFHLSQGMGRWIPPGQQRNWPLHLAASRVDGPDTDIRSGLPATLADLAAYAQAPELEASLRLAQAAIEQVMAGFPELPVVRQQAALALRYVRQAQQGCPEHARAEVVHRLQRKEQQLATVIRLASRVTARITLDRDVLHPGESVQASIETTSGDADNISYTWVLPTGWTQHDSELRLDNEVLQDDPYPAYYNPAQPRLPAIALTVESEGESSTTTIGPETLPVVLPSCSASLSPVVTVLNTAVPARSIDIGINAVHPQGAAASLELPAGWTSQSTEQGITVSAPDALATGSYTICLQLDGEPAKTVTRVVYPHIGQRALSVPARLEVEALHAELPAARVGYVGGGNDRVASWLRATGCAVTELGDADIERLPALPGIDSLVIGVFAFRTRPVLQRMLSGLHAWIAQGGNLVTLYHRPWDAWEPDATPPLPLTIGKPSLRWRICDETAQVTHLLPDHPLLNTPNRIDENDWQGWHKERGLYFASDWDAKYQALLSMADPGEEPHRGALLSVQVGRGRHTHTSLVLHHQMEKRVPGAFRLMANLLTPPG